MSLPKQVQKQLQEVEEMERQLKPAEPEKTEEHEVSPEPQPQPEPEATPTQKVEPTPETPKEDPKWEQKYRTLDGMYRAEVPRLHEQVRELTAKLDDALSKLEAATKPAKQAEPEEPLVSDKDVEAFGGDLIDVQRRVAKEVFREYVSPLQAELAKRDEKIAELEKKLGTTEGAVTTLTFEQRLNLAIPDFAQINSDPKWIEWLDEIDGLSGEPRRAFAEYVYNTGNVEKLKLVVDLFKAQTAAPAKPNVAKELERQVQPTRATASAPVTDGKRYYTEAEIAAQFNKVRQLNIQGKYEEAAKLELELSNAYVEGRVRG